MRDLLLDMAQTAVKQLNDIERAIRYQRQVVDAEPADFTSWKALEAYVLKSGDAQALADVYSDRSSFGDDAERLATLRKLARLCESEVGEVDRATGFGWRLLNSSERWRSPGQAPRDLY